MDTFGKADPFVRLYMLPDKHEVMSTLTWSNLASHAHFPISGVEDQGHQEDS